MSVSKLSSIAAVLLSGATAHAVEGTEAPNQPAPVVVELFTSQSCSSCPPAEANLRDLAKRSDIIALEWHVDYWDQLQHGRAGKWKDPFSSPAHTARQRAYNLALRGRRAVYTPQVIINGAAEVVGSKRNEIRDLIDRAAASKARIEAKRSEDHIMFSLAGPEAEVILVRFQKSAMTRVRGGENQGHELAEVNVVTSFKKIGAIENGHAEFTVKIPETGDGCALLVQEPNTGAIRGGAYCPS